MGTRKSPFPKVSSSPETGKQFTIMFQFKLNVRILNFNEPKSQLGNGCLRGFDPATFRLVSDV